MIIKVDPVISSELGEPKIFLQIFYTWYMFTTGIVTSFLLCAEFIVIGFVFHSTLLLMKRLNGP